MELRELVVALRALGDAPRLRILRQMAMVDEISVSDLSRQLRISQPLVSWHLRILRQAGLISTRKDGRQVHCRLDRVRLADCQQALQELAGIVITEG